MLLNKKIESSSVTEILISERINRIYNEEEENDNKNEEEDLDGSNVSKLRQLILAKRMKKV